MRVALAQVPHPVSFAAGLASVVQSIAGAAAAGARIVCFPECCLKGLRGNGFFVDAIQEAEHDLGIERVREAAAAHCIHVVLPTERPWRGGWQNGAYVVADDGTVSGYQSKNQVPREEEGFFVPGTTRQLFSADSVSFGVVICHEGWRYPETVRWAARRGAQLVFHPHFAGYPAGFAQAEEDAYYEHAKLCRAGENHIWFASVNFALPVQACTTSIVTPAGRTHAQSAPSQPALLVAEIEPSAATGFLARRFAPDRYVENTSF